MSITHRVTLAQSAQFSHEETHTGTVSIHAELWAVPSGLN